MFIIIGSQKSRNRNGQHDADASDQESGELKEYVIFQYRQHCDTVAHGQDEKRQACCDIGEEHDVDHSSNHVIPYIATGLYQDFAVQVWRMGYHLVDCHDDCYDHVHDCAKTADEQF